MSKKKDISKKNIEDLSDAEVKKNYIDYVNKTQESQHAFAKAGVLSAELHRRYIEKQTAENKKFNRTMRNWTIAIGVMTAIILLATLIGAEIISFGG